jgi:copper chaperone CopZ
VKKSAVAIILALATLCYAAEEKLVVSIEGMADQGCVNRITSALQQIDGVEYTDVTLKPGTATLIYLSEKTNEQAIIQKIAALGYKASSGNLIVGEATHGKSQETRLEVDALPAKNAKNCPPTCPAMRQCVGAKYSSGGLKVKAAETQIKASPAQEPRHCKGHTCPTISKCQELIDFHEAMHPLHMALSDGDYETIRAGYADLQAKAEAVRKMKCDETCVKDVKAFEKKRQEFLDCVAKLGKACQGKNDAELSAAFDNMHDAYIEMGNLAL